MPQIERSRILTISSVPTQKEGALGIIECEEDIPFEVKRVFFAYDMPKHTIRGQHANATLKEFVFCLTGSAIVETKNPSNTQTFELATRLEGVYIPPLNWVTLTADSENTSWVVLASAPYNANDQLRDFDTYRRLANEQSRE